MYSPACLDLKFQLMKHFLGKTWDIAPFFEWYITTGTERQG